MRVWIVLAVLSVTTPVYAQNLGSTSGASSEINIANPASTTSKNRLITPPPVGAPGLAAAGIETCLGSASGGVSVMGGGVTFGTTKVDEGCTIRLLSRQLFAFGYQKAALALMCQDERVAAAMAAAGMFCPGAEARARAAYAEVREPHAAYAEVREQNQVSAAPVLPFTRDEQALFDRASN